MSKYFLSQPSPLPSPVHRRCCGPNFDVGGQFQRPPRYNSTSSETAQTGTRPYPRHLTKFPRALRLDAQPGPKKPIQKLKVNSRHNANGVQPRLLTLDKKLTTTHVSVSQRMLAVKIDNSELTSDNRPHQCDACNNPVAPMWVFLGGIMAKAYNTCRAPQAATATSEALVMSQAKLV